MCVGYHRRDPDLEVAVCGQDYRGGARCNSFAPGTRVLLADGSTRPIEEVELGDRVVATDPETGETASREVVATIIGQG